MAMAGFAIERTSLASRRLLRNASRHSMRTLLLGLDTLFAVRAVIRQLAVLSLLICLSRLFHNLRTVGRHWQRHIFSFLNIGSSRKRLELLKKRRICRDYKTYKTIGEKLDILDGLDKWKNNPKSSFYNSKLLEDRIHKYKGMCVNDDLEGCMFALRGELLRKHFGFGNPSLYQVCHSGTKKLLENYISTVCQMMSWVAFAHRGGNGGVNHGNAHHLSVADKLTFFNETKHSFGRSALVLSGGAAFGMYHFGVVRALHLNGLLPRIIAGASAGSIVAAIICTSSDEQLAQMCEKNFSWSEHYNLCFFQGASVSYFIKSGGKAIYNGRAFEKALKDDIGESLTFMEAYDLTGRICNITVSGLKGSTRYPMLLNYLTSPNVLIWSAVQASCALPGVFEPKALLAKDRFGNVEPYMSDGLKWQDGSMQSDLPLSRLAELFNVNYFIVSQVNPQARIMSGIGAGTPHGPIFGLAQFLRREIKQYLLSLSELLLQRGGHRISPWLRPAGFSLVALIVQEYTGDVTIINGPGFAGMHKLLENGTTEMMQRYTDESERVTWKYMEQIKSACAIELVMDAITNELKAELSASQDVSKAARRQSLGERQGSYSLLAQPEIVGMMKQMPSFILSDQAIEHMQQAASKGTGNTSGVVPGWVVQMGGSNMVKRHSSHGLFSSRHNLLDLR